VPEPMYQALMDQSRKIGNCGTTASPIRGHSGRRAVALTTLEIYGAPNVCSKWRAKGKPHFQARLLALGQQPWSERPAESHNRRRRDSSPTGSKRSFQRATASRPRAARGLPREERLMVRFRPGTRFQYGPPRSVIPPRSTSGSIDLAGARSHWIGCGARAWPQA